MWLVHAESLSLQKFTSNPPPYVILSHRWGQEDEEVSFTDIGTDRMKRKRGYHKIITTCDIALAKGYEWVWIDTCCIDKTSSSELSESINSMYDWYKNSAFCIAYLEDYQIEYGQLAKSSWFTRCWTLQELISPSVVRFYDTKWRYFGSKKGLCREISEITGIDTKTLSGADPRRCSVAQRMSWAAKRKATRIEDEAYSLLGLFDVNLNPTYGYKEKAFGALQTAILQSPRDHDDQSIFAWDRGVKRGYQGLLATSPAAFANCQRTRRLDPLDNRCGFFYNSFDIILDLLTLPYGINTYLCVLDCSSDPTSSDVRDCIILERSDDEQQYARVRQGDISRLSLEVIDINKNYDARRRRMTVRQIPRNVSTNMIHGFLITEIDLPDWTTSEYNQIEVKRPGTGWRKTRPGPMLLTLPMNGWGAVANLLLPQPAAVDHEQHISWIKIGFDPEFRPCCKLGTVASLSDTNDEDRRSSSSQASRPRTTPEYENLDSDWLCHPLKNSAPSTVAATYNLSSADSSAESAYFYEYDQLDHQWQSFDLRTPKITVDFEVIDCPDHIDTRGLPKCGPGPWNIWQLKIVRTGDFYKEVRFREREIRDETRLRKQIVAERERRWERQENRKYQMKQGLTAAVAAVAAAAYVAG